MPNLNLVVVGDFIFQCDSQSRSLRWRRSHSAPPSFTPLWAQPRELARVSGSIASGSWGPFGHSRPRGYLGQASFGPQDASTGSPVILDHTHPHVPQPTLFPIGHGAWSSRGQRAPASVHRGQPWVSSPEPSHSQSYSETLHHPEHLLLSCLGFPHLPDCCLGLESEQPL